MAFILFTINPDLQILLLSYQLLRTLSTPHHQQRKFTAKDVQANILDMFAVVKQINLTFPRQTVDWNPVGCCFCCCVVMCSNYENRNLFLIDWSWCWQFAIA